MRGGVWSLEIAVQLHAKNSPPPFNRGVSWRWPLAYQGTKLWLLLPTSCSSRTRQLALTAAGRDWRTDHGISTQSHPSAAGLYTTKALAFHLPLFGWSLRFAGAAAIYFRLRYGYAVQISKACMRKLSTRGHHDLIDRSPQLEASLKLSTHSLRVEYVTDLSCYYLCRNMYTVYSHQHLSHVSSVASPGHNHTSQEDSSKVQTLQKTCCTVQGE
jgi:hypothetical protein